LSPEKEQVLSAMVKNEEEEDDDDVKLQNV
jgi:hypothetical protein